MLPQDSQAQVQGGTKSMKRIVFLFLFWTVAVPGTLLLAQQRDDAVEVTVGDLQATPYGVSVTLKASQSDEVLHMMIGVNEGEAIARALSHRTPPRPMTHDLITAILDKLGWHVQKVLIRDISGDTFLADLVLEKNGQTEVIDSRPSDAMAIAVRTDAKIFVSPEVFKAERQREEQELQPQPEAPTEPTPPSGEKGLHL
jgi:bifunctional DNase/RNase